MARSRLAIALVGLSAGISAWVLATEVWPQDPASSQPQFPPATVAADAAAAPFAEGPMDDQMLTGIGVDNAQVALESAKTMLPFSPRLPSHIPYSLPLYRAQTFLIGPSSNEEVIDLYYTPPPNGRTQIALHISQTNQKGFAPETLPENVGREETAAVGGGTWDYKLLEPGTGDMVIMESTLPDGVFVSVDLRVVGISTEDAKAELAKVVKSLR